MTEFDLLDAAARGMTAQRSALDLAARNVAAAQAAVPGQPYERLVARFVDDADPGDDGDERDDPGDGLTVTRERGTGDALTELIAVLDAERAYEANASILASKGQSYHDGRIMVTPMPSSSEPGKAIHRRVALYARVSTPGQRERDLSVPEQLSMLRDFCHRQGWIVDREFVDLARSGGLTIGREQFSAMINLGLSRKPPFDLILTRDASRFGRGDQDPALRSKLRANGVAVDNIESPTGDMYGELTPQQKLNERMKWAMDVNLREEIGPRVIASQRRAAASGRLPGANGTCYGYRQTYVGDGPRPRRVIELDPVRAPIVAELFRQYADGGSLRSVTAWLNGLGVSTPRGAKKWYEATVRRLLRNETVCGDIIYGRLRSKKNPQTEKHRYVPSETDPIRCKDAFPALVSRDLFEAVQRRLDKNERMRPKGGHPGNLIRGLGFCAHCGWALAFQERGGKWYYLCETKKTLGAKADKECCGTLPAKYVHAVVIQYLKRLLSAPQLEDMLKSAVEAYNAEADQHQGLPEISIVLEQIKDIERRRLRVLDAIEQGDEISSLRERLKDLEQALATARKKRDQLTIALRGIPKLQPTEMTTAVKGLRAAVRSKNLPRIKELLGAVVSRIDVDLTKRSTRLIIFNHRTIDDDVRQVVADRYGYRPDDLTLKPADDDFYKKFGGRKKYDVMMEEHRAELMREYGPTLKAMSNALAEMTARGLRLRQTAEHGRNVMLWDWNAPLTFTLRWDPGNLDRVSSDLLRKIGSITS